VECLKARSDHEITGVKKSELDIKNCQLCHAWWHTPVVPALGGLKQENGKIEASLSYTVRPSLSLSLSLSLSQKKKKM
jgi:hypothetical protein